MRIWCTVLRKNGTYQSVPVKAGKQEFELNGNKYNVGRYHIGKYRLLRSIYHEGITDPLEFDVNETLKTAKLKIDSRAVKNVTNKKILDVFGQEEFTKLEKLVIFGVLCCIAVSVINLALNIALMHRIGMI